MSADRWPDLPLESWRETCDTLHLYSQIPGKVRLALAPEEPEWQHTALFVDSRGLTTGPMPYGGFTFEMVLDLTAHELRIETSDGRLETLKLEPRSVADFYTQCLALLQRLQISVPINPLPQEVADPIPFPDDKVHASYDPHAVARAWTILSNVDAVFRRHRAPFRGRHTLVQFFWGTFDVAYARYSGKAAQPPPGANLIMRKGMDAQEVCSGFWFGDARFSEPAFYCYAYPKPDGFEKSALSPAQAFWSAENGLLLLRYKDVRASGSPEDAILQFLQSSFEAGSADWSLK